MFFSFLFNKQNRVTSILSLFYIVLGVLFCIIPLQMLSFLESTLCFLFLAYGGVILFAYSLSSVVLNNRMLMLSAILAVILGVLLLFVRSFLLLALAVCLLLLAITKILVLKKFEINNWYKYCLLSLLIIEICAFITLVVFFILNDLKMISMIIIGICLIFEFLVNAVTMYINYRNYKTINRVETDEDEKLDNEKESTD